MKKIFIVIGIMIVFSANVLLLGKASFSTLSSIDYNGNSVTIITDKPVKYNVFKVSKPPRLVVDLKKTEHPWCKRSDVFFFFLAIRISLQ